MENYLTLIEEHYEKTKSGKWKGLYQCQCGKQKSICNGDVKSGKVKSCGCYKKKILSELYTEDLSGKIFGYWKVLYKNQDKTGHGAIWHCLCTNCGEEKDVRAENLKSGASKSCGCYRKELYTDDLINQQFGKLTVIKALPNFKGIANCAYWLCKCECGKEKVVDSWSLKSGNTKSCGCLISKGENLISNYLDNNQIKYIPQYTFDDLVYKSKLKFDFFLPDFNILIEYQGKQHYEIVEAWGGEVGLKERQIKDQMKKDYCKNNNFRLIEIPYWEFDNIKSILSNLFKEGLTSF